MAAQGQLDPQIYHYFQQFDTSRSGWIDINELQRSLKNDYQHHFRLETCKIMLDMFDHNNCGQINAYQFQELWQYLVRWRQTFTGYDKSGDGRLDREETLACLQGMGYVMPPTFFDLCLKKFDLDNAGSFRFDDFVRIGIFIQSVTKGFAKFDTQDGQASGTAVLSFEQLLELAFMSTGAEPRARAPQPNPYAVMQPVVINVTINNTNTNINKASSSDSEPNSGESQTEEPQ